MRKLASLVLAGVVPFCVGAREKTRPKILGIARVEILSSNVPAAQMFYGQIVAAGKSCMWCEKTLFDSVMLPSAQVIDLAPLPAKPPKRLLVRVSFEVDNEDAMKRWLKTNHVSYKEISASGNAGCPALSTVDPEGHEIWFIDGRAKRYKIVEREIPTVGRMIHAGFVVRDREAMDKFYKDILGFHVYWHGGMKDGETDWEDMQVPDGTDWIEYMLNVPENADKHTLGVMNHIALGVLDVRAAAEQLKKNGVKLTEEPKIGRDGKWQLNLYDPDETRVELMEFTPVEKPCCAEYTGNHPKP